MNCRGSGDDKIHYIFFVHTQTDNKDKLKERQFY